MTPTPEQMAMDVAGIAGRSFDAGYHSRDAEVKALRAVAEAARQLAEYGKIAGTIRIDGNAMSQVLKTPLGHLAHDVLNALDALTCHKTHQVMETSGAILCHVKEEK